MKFNLNQSIESLDRTPALLRNWLLGLDHAWIENNTDLQRTGTHPSFGQVTLQQLLATWVTHDLNHIHQIAKCMAWQYRDEIGPWREYVIFIDR